MEGLKSGAYGIGLEESAGASFLKKDGTVWTTDKDGIIMDLLAAEITARTGKDPGDSLPGIDRTIRRTPLRADGCPGLPGSEGDPEPAFPGIR